MRPIIHWNGPIHDPRDWTRKETPFRPLSNSPMYDEMGEWVQYAPYLFEMDYYWHTNKVIGRLCDFRMDYF